MPIDVAALLERVQTLRSEPANPPRRTLIGIAGPPGAGKSTLADMLVRSLRESGSPAVALGLDGFHLAQALLTEAGTADIKGAPETFDPQGYLALLRRLRSDSAATIYAPQFDRSIEQPIAGAIPIGPEVSTIVTEGNYLLLERPPWCDIAALLDEVWYLDVPEDVRVERLVARHIRFGREPGAARRRATVGPDGANARLVIASRPRADLIVAGGG